MTQDAARILRQPLSGLPKRLTGLGEGDLRSLLAYETEHENRLAVRQIIGNYLTGINHPEN
ncbi:hypothetical protein [Subtercola vilae]|uniref:Uncharacterized protein n=1 Tax=Subtercola vilae TaxID=2056433 RepID=A0A4T2BDP2_9MICO|nr:hypothetical protein [Subtercola vilae]TIH29493.1 hypothetical protein D4765_17925 [Subtercola vilae]